MKYISIFIFLFNSTIAYATYNSEKLKSYVNNIKSIAVEFSQSDGSGAINKGMLIIDKPYKFRCNYYTPFPLLIVGNNHYVSIYDYHMQSLARIQSTENVFYFLLLDNIVFDNTLKILSEYQKHDNYVVQLKHTGTNKKIEVSFNTKSKDIKKMKIFESHQVITLNFSKIHKISNIPKSLFILKDPDIFGQPERLDKKALQKKLKLVK